MGMSLSGLTGGIDFTSLISQLMSVQQQPLVAYQQQLAGLQTQQGAIGQIQSDVSALETAVQQLTLTSTVGAKSATSSSSGVSATATPDATNATYSVVVKQLATPTQVTSGSIGGAPAAMGAAVNLTAPLASAGFATPVTNGTFSINGVSFTIDANSVLDDPTNPANSLVDLINNSSAGVTASVVNDAYGRPDLIQLTSKSGTAIQLGSSSDTSNFLTASGLAGGAIVGNTATSVTGSSVGSGALSATLTINGIGVTIAQTNGSFTGAQNAAAIASAINSANLGVTATTTGANGDQVQLTLNTPGSQGTISLSSSGANAAALGLTSGTYQNGTDDVVGGNLLGAIDPSSSLSSNTFATPLAPVNGGGSFTINGVAIDWSSGDSLNDVLNRINASSAGVRATYDPLSDRVTLTSTGTGGGAIAMQDTSGNFLQALHVLSSPTSSVPQQLGQNAIVNISGVNGGNDLTVPSNTVSSAIPGVTLTLQQASSSPVTVTVGQDTSTTTTAVQNFVTAVNTLYGDIDKYTASNPGGTSGVLAGDPEIQGIETAVQEMIDGVVSSGPTGYQDLASVGISTGAIGSPVQSSYTLQLDTQALTQALQNNPTAVTQLLVGNGSTQGFAVQLNNYLNGLTGPNGLFSSETSAISSSEQMVNDTISQMQEQLAQYQQSLQTEFAQLQTTLGTLQSQGAMVAAQVGSLGGSMLSSSSSSSSSGSSSSSTGG